MRFNTLDKTMRVYETASDRIILPGIYRVARLDGRSFTRLTKKKLSFEAPFDSRFKDIMIRTVMHLMDCGFKITYGYTQSDEISLLFDLHEDTFQRKERKLVSVLSGEASAKFSLALGDMGVFDCRISELPTEASVVDYFRWRQEDAHRNALNAMCYWTLRKNGMSPSKSNARISGCSLSDKHELLYQFKINFNDLPEWQKRGVGVYWKSYDKQGVNLKTGETVVTQRKRLAVNDVLPFQSDYETLIRQLISSQQVANT